MNDQKEFIEALATIMDVQSQEELEEGIKNLGEEGLKLMYQQYKQVKDKGTQGLQLLKQAYNKILENKQIYAKLGAKLDYINQLRGKCPEGYEVEKFGAGGCVKCKKKQLEKQQIVERFKSEKCGGTMKKRVPKKEEGSKVTHSRGFNGNTIDVKSKGRDLLHRPEIKRLVTNGKDSVIYEIPRSNRFTNLNPTIVRTDNKSEKWDAAKSRFKNFK